MMAARKVAEFQVNRLYRFKKPTILDDNLRSQLPEAYKKFYKEWQMSVPSPVHFIPRKEKWERKKTGEVHPVQNFPILPKYPEESHKGLWGGEGVVEGFVQRKGRYAAKVPHFWFPCLKRSVVYSEIVNKYMSIVLTSRTVDLILDNHGLDHYLLKTRACDIQSELGVKLKRKLLLALLHKDLYHDDPVKQEQVYNKYKNYLDDYTTEEIEWYGLNMYEALMKLENDREAAPPQPMKYELRKRLVEELKLQVINELEVEATKVEESDSSKKSWMSKINPFGQKQK